MIRRGLTGLLLGVGAAAALATPGLLVLGEPVNSARAPVAPASPPAPPTPERERASGPGLRLLERAARAARTQAYSGTQFVSAWGQGGAASAVVSLTHVPGHGSVINVAPTAGTNAPAAAAPALLPDDLGGEGSGGPLDSRAVSLLQQHYDLRVGDPDECAGRSAQVVEVRRTPQRGGGLAGRFWLDQETGLVLRREVVDRTGSTVRASAFVEFAVGAEATAPNVEVASALPAEPDGTAIAGIERDRLRQAGHALPELLPDELALTGVRQSRSAEEQVLHASYSDGLTTLSLFQQRGALDPEQLDGWEQVSLAGTPAYVLGGMPQRVGWESDGTVYTLVGDAAPGTVESVVASLPHAAPDDPAVTARLMRGMTRVGSWFNPWS